MHSPLLYSALFAQIAFIGRVRIGVDFMHFCLHHRELEPLVEWQAAAKNIHVENLMRPT